MPKRLGGKNYVEFFSLTSSGGNVSFNTSQLANNQVFATTYSGHPKSKNLKIDLDSDFDSQAYDTLLQTYLVAQSSPETGIYEDSTPSTPNAGNYSNLLGIVCYGGVGTVDAKVKVAVGIGQITGGDFKTEANKAARTKVGFEFIQHEFPLVIAAAKFATTKVSDGALTTFAAGGTGSFVYLTPA
jgi:hypothetical protein